MTIVPLPPAAPAITPEVRRAAQDFEAMALGALLEPIFATADLSQGPFGGGEAERTWTPMLVQEIAKRIAAQGGLGIAATVAAEMQRLGRTKP
jgi:peptidoglycan hydrolase FlgJ